MNVDPRGFIDSVTWRFARTMPENPHWYVVERDVGGPEFEHSSRSSAQATLVTIGGWPYRTVTVDGFDYWLTWAGDAGHFINRKPSAEADWDEA
jgi:hypothetical protein